MDEAYRFEELGWLLFQELADAVVAAHTPLGSVAFTGQADRLRAALALDGVPAGPAWPALRGPTLVASAFVPRDGPRRAQRIADSLRLLWARHAGEGQAPRTVLLLSNAEPIRTALLADGLRRCEPVPADIVVLGAAELGTLVDASPDLRLELPALLGVAPLDALLGEAAARSTLDLGAARSLARVFVPTRAYASGLATLRRHGLAVLAGPPEMGKTAIARTLGLGLATAGWEVHECVHPEQLWRAYEPTRRQLFVADDAFGSTEYRPEAAERWARELERLLSVLDERHWLVWTSRPAPLRAALARLARDHSGARLPPAAQVHVAAADLDVAERALILYRHVRAAAPSRVAVGLVRRHGLELVDHPHFTPERIRRFVAGRLQGLAALVEEGGDLPLAATVAEEIREPTEAMAASYWALADEERDLLVALLDAPVGPVPERDLAASLRRHHDGGLSRAPADLVERLGDHFVRVVPPASVTWVHPSWRDLVIEQLAGDGPARRRFLSRASLEGLLLAFSVAGGAAGERRLPLLHEDADWDALTARLASLAGELDDAAVVRLLDALSAALDAPNEAHDRGELEAVAHGVLQRLDRTETPPPGPVVESWVALAAVIDDPPPLPDLDHAWVDLVPTAALDVSDPADRDRFDRWLSLVEALGRHAPSALSRFGFPLRQEAALHALARRLDAQGGPEAWTLLRRLARVLPRGTELRANAYDVASRLVERMGPVSPAPLERAGDTGAREQLVARILDDL